MVFATGVRESEQLQSLARLLRSRVSVDMKVEEVVLPVRGKGTCLTTALVVTVSSLGAIDLFLALVAGWLRMAPQRCLNLQAEGECRPIDSAPSAEFGDCLKRDLERAGAVAVRVTLRS